MKILVVGTGAIGSCYGGVLHKDGNDVVFLSRGNNLKSINSNGLEVKSVKFGDFLINPKATDSLSMEWKADLILYCVKSFHNQNAVPLLLPAIDENTCILTLQNGFREKNFKRLNHNQRSKIYHNNHASALTS